MTTSEPTEESTQTKTSLEADQLNDPLPIVVVPEIAKRARPWAQVVDVGPPPNVKDAECGTANSLIEPGQLGPYTVNEWRTFFQPTAEQIETLKNGGTIAFVMLSGQMVPHRAEVWRSGTNSAPAATPVKVVLQYTDKTYDECFAWEGKEAGVMPTTNNIAMSDRAVQLADRITIVFSDKTERIIKNRSGNYETPSE
jgi:hypothetical protein